MRPQSYTSILSLFLIATVACGGEPVDPPPPGDFVKSSKERITAPVVAQEDFETQMTANRSLAFDLYAQFAAEPGNIFFSPHSISMAFAMVYAGARGDTEQQMKQALHLDLSQARLHPAFNKLDQELDSRGQGSTGADGGRFRLNNVNAIWGARGYRFLPGFLDTLALNYGAGLNLMDFATAADASRIQINEWVADMTEQRIKDLLPEGSVKSDTAMVLTNAIYFNAAWRTKFNKDATSSGAFTLADGTQINVPTMRGDELRARYARDDINQLDAVELAYDGDELSMLIIAPDAGQLSAVESRLDGAFLNDTLESLEGELLDLKLPSFEVEFTANLRESLEPLGMTDIFSSDADLSGMDGQKGLTVTGAFHKAFVKVNEAGTEAAAATGIVVGPTSIPVTIPVSIDRPFIYLIRDHGTGAVLFVGRMVDPR